jgi:hypothetical protein
MRRTLFLAALLFAAPAQAATSLPAATEPGISASRLTGGSYLVKFTQTAYKGVAGRDFTIVCFNSNPRLGGSGPPKRSVTHLRRLPLRHASVRVKPSRGDDVCAFVRGEASPADADFFIALTTSGRRWLADFRTSAEVGALLLSARTAGASAGAWPAYSQLPKRARRLAAHLPSPGATPSGKAIGYYSDGKQRVTVTGISSSGARLFFAMNGDDAATNTPVVTNAVAPPSEPSGQLPVGPFPAAGTPLPDATVAGVTATQSGSDVAVSFAGPDAEAAYARLAGQRTVATCSRTQVPVLGIEIPRDVTFTVTAPAQVGTLHLNVGSGAVSTCSLGIVPGAPVVQVAVGETGRAPLEDGLGAQALLIVARRASGTGSGSYLSSASTATSLSNSTAVLASPADTPADRSVGVYSDAKQHLAVVVRTLTGRRLYADFDGPVLKTNLLSVTQLVPF